MVTKQKILIVDDDENIAELISLYLTKECFDTMIVHDGEEALTAFESYQPNLMLLDLCFRHRWLSGLSQRSAVSTIPQSLCFPQKEKYLTRCSDLELVPMLRLKTIRFQGACRKSKSGHSDAISLPNQKLLPPAAERLLTIRESRSILPITQ